MPRPSHSVALFVNHGMFTPQLDLQGVESARHEGELCGLQQITLADPPRLAGSCHRGSTGEAFGPADPHSNEDSNKVSQYSPNVSDSGKCTSEPAESSPPRRVLVTDRDPACRSGEPLLSLRAADAAESLAPGVRTTRDWLGSDKR